MGFDPLPTSLDHALAVMERSELVAETLGEQVFAYLIRDKRREVSEYRSQVTPYELSSMLDTV
jgi:glutamine synthetase